MANDGALKLTGKKGAAYSGGSKASYTPSASIDPKSYGKSGSKATRRAAASRPCRSAGPSRSPLCRRCRER